VELALVFVTPYPTHWFGVHGEPLTVSVPPGVVALAVPE
jgi:hypothetical protein